MRALAAMIVVLVGAWPAAAATLRMAVDILPPSLANPYRSSLPPTVWSVYALFDALTRFDANNQLQPALAVGWEKIDDLTWRFTLRDGVTFHNGQPFDAAAVKAAVDYVTSDAAAREGLKREIAVLAGARVVDRLTVDILTTEPAPQMPRYATGLMIGEPAAFAALGRDGFARQPVGTGPFKLDEMADNAWRLSAFDAAWRKAKVAGLHILAVPEAAARVSGLLAGRLDIVMSLNPDSIDAIVASGGRTYVASDPAVFGISFITGKPGPWQDARVRRALNMAVNRQGIIDVLLTGATVPAGQPAARAVLGHDPALAPYPYDPQGAKRLLAEAGHGNGFSFVLEAATGIDPNDAAVYQQIQADLRAVGVAMEIRTVPATQFYNALRMTEFSGDAFPIDWPSWPTIDVTRALLPHSCERLKPWYCDPAIMPKLVAARTEWDEASALTLRRELMRHYRDQAPAIFLYENVTFVGLGKGVSGFGIVNGVHIAFEDIELAP
ncbi:MAG: ABC transporter substrate-binding protein [Rhodospirillaceae bacterium]|nr:ABC transporter substrate-binding protein [Rhodospirillaceae bacterium]